MSFHNLVAFAGLALYAPDILDLDMAAADVAGFIGLAVVELVVGCKNAPMREVDPLIAMVTVRQLRTRPQFDALEVGSDRRDRWRIESREQSIVCMRHRRAPRTLQAG